MIESKSSTRLVKRLSFGTIVTASILLLTMAGFFGFNTPTTVQFAEAHVDPGTCITNVANVGITPFRGASAIGTGPVFQGETILYRAEVSAPNDPVNHCATDGGTLSIQFPNATSVVVDSASVSPPVPCLGGTTNSGDLVGAADCGTNSGSTTFLSPNLAPYVVDCTDDGLNTPDPIDGKLRGRTVYDLFAHDDPSDTTTGSATITKDNPCKVASTELLKIANVTFVNPDEAILYTYLEHNNGTAILNAPTLTDDLCSPVTAREGGGFNVGDINFDGNLDPTETWQYECTFVPQDCSAYPVVDGVAIIRNNVTSQTTINGTANGAVGQLPAVPDENATASVACLDPHTTLTKTANVTSIQPGDGIHYNYTETNDGNIALNAPTLTDDLCSPVTARESGGFNVGDTNTNGLLDSGETWVYDCDYGPVRDCDGFPLVEGVRTIINNVTSTTTVVEPFGDKRVEDENATATVTCSSVPHTTLTKQANVTFVNPGEAINYHYNETNDGGVVLNAPTLTDNICSPVAALESGGFNVGDTNTNGLLDPGEKWEYQCDFTPVNCDYPVTNGVALINNTVISNTTTAGTQAPVPDENATASVACLDPHTTLTKTANMTSFTGNATGKGIHYNYTETNDGNIALNAPTLTDDLCSPVTARESGGFNVGDTNTNGLLDSGETWVYDCDYVVTNTDCADGSIVNNVTSTTTVVDPFGNKRVEDENATATVKCLFPTRTPGYWMTHLDETQYAMGLPGWDPINCGTFNANTIQRVMGGFWSSVSYESDGDRRNKVDQAAMQLAFQLQAAKLNFAAFGSTPDSFGVTLAQAESYFCTGTRAQMLSAASALNAFNNSGDGVPFPTGFPNNGAEPKAAQATANKAYWDQPNLPRAP